MLTRERDDAKKEVARLKADGQETAAMKLTMRQTDIEKRDLQEEIAALRCETVYTMRS